MPGYIFAAVIVLTAGILGATDNVARAEAPLRLDYEVYGGGAHALDLNLRLVTTESGAESGAQSGDYTVAFQARTAGWVARLFPFVLESRAEGRLRDGVPVPRGFATANRWDDKDIRRVRLDYTGEGAAPEVTAEPPSAEDDRSVVPELARRDTRDPLSAIFALLLGRGAAACTGTVEVFDGRRRYDISARPDGEDSFAADDTAVYAGPAQICTLEFARKDGFWTKYDARNRYPTTVRVWLAPVVESAPPLPVKVALETAYVAVRAHLTALHRGGAAALPATDLGVALRAQAGNEAGNEARNEAGEDGG